MNADSATLEDLLNSPNQYVIPIFQRNYSWERKNWINLWEDIEELWTFDRGPEPHFMGPVVLDSQKQRSLRRPKFQVIDGQQRLVTLSLLMCALRNIAKHRKFDELRTTVEELALYIPRAKGQDRLRVYPRQQDRHHYIAAVEGEHEVSGTIGSALRFFSEGINSLEETETEEQLEEFLFLLLRRLEFVHIILEGENPYQIFKGLNSTGQALSEADLVRNFVFMNMPLEEQDRFDKDYWKPLEHRFEDNEERLQGRALSGFFRDFLMRTGRYVKPAATFHEFEYRYSGARFEPEDLAIELGWHADHYDIIRGVTKHDSEHVELALDKLRGLQTSTTYPLLLNLLHRTAEGEMTNEDLASCLEMLSGFILRRYVNNESSRTYYRWFVTVCRELGDQPRDNLQHFLMDKGYPEDARFAQAFVHFNLYQSDYGRYVLEMLERAQDHKEPPDLSKAQIEHVMPRTLTDEWRQLLGDYGNEHHAEWLHRVGNLTLTGYNPELSNSPFSVKRGKYAQSNVEMNKEISRETEWTPAQIEERGKKLAQRALELWPGPNVA